MPDNRNRLSTDDIEERIRTIGPYSRLVKAGLGEIIGAFLPTLVGKPPYDLDCVPEVVDAVLVPSSRSALDSSCSASGCISTRCISIVA